VRLIFPYVGNMKPTVSRIAQLAEFLGIRCESRALSRVVAADDTGAIHAGDCLCIHPDVVQAWCAYTGRPVADASALVEGCYSQLLVYGLRAGAFDSALVQALSGGRLQSIEGVNGESPYTCSKDAREFCGSFAGLTFGRADSTNDHVFTSAATDCGIEPQILIDDKPFVVLIRERGMAAVFVAGEELADLDMAAGDTPLTEYFSRFVPYAMALRYLAGDKCWRPIQALAAVVIDDPLLRTKYGFLNFRSLLSMAEKHNFHAAIGFIPHNFRRNTRRVVRLFLENPERLSICFHGNDHTQGEFASLDSRFLNLLLSVATKRMALHQKRTGLACDPVMVFPQGKFSTEAMRALQAHNFYAAVNTTPHPAHDPTSLTLRELAQPAVLRYGGFPLFLRKPVDKIRPEDIAFNVFFGRPVLIVEHHQDFEHEERLIALVEQINSTVPEMQWSSLATVTRQSMLRRTTPDGRQEIRAYAGTVTIAGDADTERSCSIEWGGWFDSETLAGVVAAGRPCKFERTGDFIRVRPELAAGQSMMLSLVHAASHPSSRTLDMRWKTKAFVRRRLSEFRDNYLYKHRKMLQAARAVQHRFSRA
jgi:hypothetical protein